MGKVNYQNRGARVLQRIAEERTIAALRDKNTLCAKEHAKVTDEELIKYLRQCALSLGHSPNMDEVIGGRFIAYRFDGWTKAISAARLPLPQTSPELRRRKIYKDELKRQMKLLTQERRKS